MIFGNPSVESNKIGIKHRFIEDETIKGKKGIG